MPIRSMSVFENPFESPSLPFPILSASVSVMTYWNSELAMPMAGQQTPQVVLGPWRSCECLQNFSNLSARLQITKTLI